LVPDEALESFLHHCSESIGDAYFRTPRNTIKAFLDMLAVLEQNPNIIWSELIKSVSLQEERSSDFDIETSDTNVSDGLADLQI
jgi:hypothetical protein